MANEPVNNMYGYASDDVQVSVPFVFGLNAGVTTLEKFEWIPNGGKDGAEQEAIDIIFKINGTEKSYRKFPITKAFDKNNQEVTDPSAPEFRDAVQTLNSVITHILKCFVTDDQLMAAFSKPVTSFKQFAQVCASVLPADFKERKLDIFMQYQWNLREGQKQTYLEIPPSMKNGKWLCPAIAPVGSWKEVRKADPSDNDQNALYYVDEANNTHLFKRHGRYVKGPLANQQKSEEAQAQEQAAQNMNSGAGAGSTNSGGAAGSTVAGW
jgi:hypothetical protein